MSGDLQFVCFFLDSNFWLLKFKLNSIFTYVHDFQWQQNKSCCFCIIWLFDHLSHWRQCWPAGQCRQLWLHLCHGHFLALVPMTWTHDCQRHCIGSTFLVTCYALDWHTWVNWSDKILAEGPLATDWPKIWPTICCICITRHQHAIETGDSASLSIVIRRPKHHLNTTSNSHVCTHRFGCSGQGMRHACSVCWLLGQTIADCSSQQKSQSLTLLPWQKSSHVYLTLVGNEYWRLQFQIHP